MTDPFDSSVVQSCSRLSRRSGTGHAPRDVRASTSAEGTVSACAVERCECKASAVGKGVLLCLQWGNGQ